MQPSQAASQPRLISPRAVADRLSQARDSLILLDVRTAQEWRYDGRIDGARLIPIEEIQGRAGELPKEAEIIVYCHTGMRSRAVAQFLARSGFQNVADMAGGIEAWEWAGLPVERG